MTTALVFLTLFAFAAAYVGFASRTAQRRERLAESITARGGSVYTASDLALPGSVSPLREWFGDQPVARIYLPPPGFTHEDFELVHATFPEAHVFPLSPLDSDRIQRAAPRR